MKRLLAFILLFQLASAGWVENLTVYAFDASGRQLPGALVEIRYQRERYPIIGGGFDGVATGYTDENGMPIPIPTPTPITTRDIAGSNFGKLT